MPKSDLFHGENYKGYELAQKNQKYSLKYLDKAVDLIETMTERHSKVLTVRVDVRYPTSINSDGTNRDFQHLMENLMKADIRGHVAHIKNPTSGHIVADSIGSVTIDENVREPNNCVIEVRNKRYEL